MRYHNKFLEELEIEDVEWHIENCHLKVRENCCNFEAMTEFL